MTEDDRNSIGNEGVRVNGGTAKVFAGGSAKAIIVRENIFKLKTNIDCYHI